VHAAHRRGPRIAAIEGVERTRRSLAQIALVAEEEVELVTDLEGERVGRPDAQQLVEDGGCAIPVAVEPRTDRRRVSRLAVIERGGDHRRVRRPRRRQLGHIGGDQAEIRHQRVAHREVGMLECERAGEVDDLGLEAKQLIEGAFVGLGCVHGLPLEWSPHHGRGSGTGASP
jgi:hypothetical protein